MINPETLEAVTHTHTHTSTLQKKQQLNSSVCALLELGEFLLSYKKIKNIEKMEMLYL